MALRFSPTASVIGWNTSSRIGQSSASGECRQTYKCLHVGRVESNQLQQKSDVSMFLLNHRLERMQSFAAPPDYSLWSDDEVEGKELAIEEGIFEDVVERPAPPKPAKLRSIAKQIEVPRSRLVPEEWRELQKEMNKTRKEKKKDLLQARIERAKDKKAKARGKLSSIIEESEEEKQVDDAEVTHTIFADGQRHRTSYPVEDDDSENYDDSEDEDENEAEQLDWPYAVRKAEQEPIEEAPSGPGRAVPRNPRLALGELTFEQLAEKMNKPEPEPEPEPEDDNSVKGLQFTKEEKSLLRKRDPDFKKITSEKWMPLHTLSSSAQTILVAELLKHGADIDALDKDGLTALHRGVMGGRLAITKHLVKAGANVFVKDKDGATLLHYAVSSASPNVVKALLRFGVDINSSDNDGWTPLHVAVQGQKTDIVRILLKRGADRTLKNKDGNTPVDLAYSFGKGFHTEAVVKLLKTQQFVPETVKGYENAAATEIVANAVDEHNDEDEAGLVDGNKHMVERMKETRDLMVKVNLWKSRNLL